MKNIFLTGLFAFTFLFASCEDSSENDLNNNNEEIIEENDTNVDKLYPSKVNVTSLETVQFYYTVKTDGLAKRDLYDSITFSVSGIEEEFRVFRIGYEDPNDPIGNPAEYQVENWYHTFISIGAHEAKLIGYKNGTKKTLDAVTFGVTNPNDFFNIDWSDPQTKSNSYTNSINNFVLNVSSKYAGSVVNRKKVAGASYSWKYKSWPYTQQEFEKGRDVLYNAMVKLYGEPTYTKQDDLVKLFNDSFVDKIDELDDIECIWITEKNKIALLSTLRFNEFQKFYELYAQEKE